MAALRSMLCGGLGLRMGGSRDGGGGGRISQQPEKDALNGERDKLRLLCAAVDRMSKENEAMRLELSIITQAIREAPEQKDDHCAACPLPRMKKGLKRRKGNKDRG